MTDEEAKLLKMLAELQELKQTEGWKMMEKFNERLDAKEKRKHEWRRRKWQKAQGNQVTAIDVYLRTRGG
jgi:hypothetical protein